MNRLSSLLSWTLVLSALHTSLPAADWPTYGGDHHQSGVTTERINVPLKEAWAVRTPAPRPAWPEPARQDFWHNAVDLQPSVTFDRAPHAVVAEGAVYLGSTVDDKITCLDLKSGHQRWSFFTEGPVRVTPTVSAGRVYAGSDDGFVYCLTAADGTLLWKHRVGPDDRRLPGNGRMISLWPVRAGVTVHGGTAYCCAGVFPQQGVYVCALNAEDGSPRWKQPFTSGAPQGHLLLSDTRLFVPTGRTSPAVFDRVSGKFLGAIDGFGRGGNFALVNEEVVVYRGQGEQDLTVTDVETREKIVRFTGRRMVVRGNKAFLQTAGELSALDRPRFLDLARHRNRVTAHRREIEGHLKAAIKKAKEAPPKESPPEETTPEE
ncbi:MAG: PQQ-like beta-propeller repeat protein, partial [Planctomycetes bacterium]|nr:PQQ-like beta-propeller repeat protein [Planctomycetota bacterium]